MERSREALEERRLSRILQADSSLNFSIPDGSGPKTKTSPLEPTPFETRLTQELTICGFLAAQDEGRNPALILTDIALDPEITTDIRNVVLSNLRLPLLIRKG